MHTLFVIIAMCQWDVAIKFLAAFFLSTIVDGYSKADFRA